MGVICFGEVDCQRHECDAQSAQLGHRAVLGGQRAIETVRIQDPKPARNRTREVRGGEVEGDGSACEWESITYGAMGRTAVNSGHRREKGTASRAAARRRRTGSSARSSCCTREAACHRDCCTPGPYTSPESNPGSQGRGGRGQRVNVRVGADHTHGAMERTAVTGGHRRRGDGTVSGAAARRRRTGSSTWSSC